MSPEISLPSATQHAPVSVAKSTIFDGEKPKATSKQSANTNRPSASVLCISMVLPLLAVRTSPNFMASPDTMFSTSPRTATRLHGAWSLAAACMIPSTVAAPAMSHFIVNMPSVGLSEYPPLSNVTPFPTSAIGGVVGLLPRYCNITNRGSLTDPWATPSKEPQRSVTNFALSQTSMPSLYC